MIVKLLAEHHLECLSLKGDCTGSSESTHVKMSHCWKSHALAQMIMNMTRKCHNRTLQMKGRNTEHQQPHGCKKAAIVKKPSISYSGI